VSPRGGRGLSAGDLGIYRDGHLVAHGGDVCGDRRGNARVRMDQRPLRGPHGLTAPSTLDLQVSKRRRLLCSERHFSAEYHLRDLVPKVMHFLSQARIPPPTIGRNDTGLLVPPSPLRPFRRKADSGAAGRMADDHVSVEILRIVEGVVTNDKPRSDRVALIRRNNARQDAWIVPWCNERPLENSFHPPLLCTAIAYASKP